MSDDTPDQTATDEEIEERYSDESSYTIKVNGKRYELNKAVRQKIQERARHEYDENWMLSCWWKKANPDQYPDGEWDNTIHDAGDPVLVIETTGPVVPWERLDQLDVEMQEPGPDSGFDGAGQKDDVDNGNGMKLVPQDDDDDVSQQIGRTHFDVTPQSYEEVPSPDGEDPEKIPPEPEQMDDEPEMVKWIPDHPELEHTWDTGRAICEIDSRVEWNVQKKAEQPNIVKEKENSHDLWEALLANEECEVVAELKKSQDTPSTDSSQDSGKEEEDVGPKYGGNNWKV